MLILQMFPTTLTLVAPYAIFDSVVDVSLLVGINSHMSLVLVYMFGIMMHIWTLKGYFDGVDTALDKAAAMDGASPLPNSRQPFNPRRIGRSVAQSGSAPASGAGGRRFESSRSDQIKNSR
jgi:maltose/maltodextrin transport system permease protein